MEFFKVYVVKDDLVRIWERDCVELTDRYAFVRALRCAGTEYNWRICLSMVSDKYFRTLAEAKQYIKDQRELKVKGLKQQIEGLKKAIEYQTEMIDKFTIDSDWDYDDRGIDYTRK
jgi:hypothetical protein